MHAETASPESVSSLAHFCRPLDTLLRDPAVTELCLQTPGEILLERSTGWTRVAAEWATLEWARHFARLVATSTDQRISAEAPLLSASLPTGERVQIVLPPATLAGRVAVAIRRPGDSAWSLDELGRAGLFAHCRVAGGADEEVSRRLAVYFGTASWQSFLALAVRSRLNLLVSGATGSGKTTLTKALVREIPADERLISIEDAAELSFEQHANVVRLFYSKDGQGLARVTPKSLLEASLRLRPDRILLAELRGEEAYYYLRNVGSGHPGSITSIHAGSTVLAFDQLALLVKESAPGREMPLVDIHRMVRGVVDVVVQCVRSGGKRRISEIWWRGAAESRSMARPAGS